MIKKILVITVLLIFAYTNSSLDTTTIVKIYEIDNCIYYDYIMDGELYEKVFVEDL